MAMEGAGSWGVLIVEIEGSASQAPLFHLDLRPLHGPALILCVRRETDPRKEMGRLPTE